MSSQIITSFTKKSMPIWTTKLEVMVIEFYREHSFLWDPKNKMYYNRDAREMALQDLADSLGSDEADRAFTSNDVKDKFKNMRAVYGREQVKIDQTLKWGSDDVYEPKWIHFPRMQGFLFNVFKPRAASGAKEGAAGGTPSATNSRSSYSTTMEEDDEEEGGGDGRPEDEEPDMDGSGGAGGPLGHEVTAYLDDGYYEAHMTKHNDDDDAPLSTEPLVLTDTPSPHMVMMGAPHKKARCSRKQGSSPPGTGGGDGRYLVEALRMMRAEHDKRLDPEDSFCGNVAGTLRRLSPYNRERAKMEIQKLLFEIEFGEKSGEN